MQRVYIDTTVPSAYFDRRTGVTYMVPTDGFWSPTGANVVYRLLTYKSWPTTMDVYRATSAGASCTNLTSDISSRAIPLGWRAEP